MCINYTSGLDFLAIDRGQTGIPVGLKSADSLAHQDQDAGAGLYWAIWDEATQGYRPSLPQIGQLLSMRLRYSPG